MDEVIIVCSLPRTGTKSLCKMLNVLGYKSKHLPSVTFQRQKTEGFNAFADTPCYRPSFIKEQLFTNSKFIFSDRGVDGWADSIEKVKIDKGYELLMNLTNPAHLNQFRLMDMLSMGEVFGYGKKYDRDHFIMKFLEHKRQVIDMIPPERLLVYNFSEGWEPLCSFLGKDVPDEPIPQLNQNVINEKI